MIRARKSRIEQIANGHAVDLSRPLRIKTRGTDIGRSIVSAGVFGILATIMWPTPTSWIHFDFLFGVSVLGCCTCLVKCGILLVQDYRLRRDIAISEMITTDHGSAREATRAEMIERGMDDWRNGELLGLEEDDTPVWAPRESFFKMFEMGPGVGKTSCYVINSILHRAKLGYSVVVADPKTDLAPILAPSLRELGYTVWCVNPAKAYFDLVGDTEINVKQPLIDAVHADGSERLDTVKHASDQARLHYRPVKNSMQPYFEFGSQRVIIAADVSNALIDPGNCTGTSLYQLLVDPERFLQRMRDISKLETLMPDDPVVGFLKGEARNLLQRAKKNKENFGAFLEGASQRLISFNPAGRLGGYGCGAVHRISEIRERQVIVFIMAPLGHIKDFADFISLFNHGVISACKAKPDGHPVHIVAEEALNYRFDDLASDMETLRQLNVTADIYIQSFEGLERLYGREAARAIETYSDIRIYAGVNNLERARQLSEMMSDETIRKQDFSYGANAKQIDVGSRELPRRFMKPDEIMSMPPGYALAFIRGMRPKMLRMVSYAQVDPWTHWVGPSPITGTRIEADPILKVDYSQYEEKGAV